MAQRANTPRTKSTALGAILIGAITMLIDGTAYSTPTYKKIQGPMGEYEECYAQGVITRRQTGSTTMQWYDPSTQEGYVKMHAHKRLYEMYWDNEKAQQLKKEHFEAAAAECGWRVH